jgi:hypothetical protein
MTPEEQTHLQKNQTKSKKKSFLQNARWNLKKALGRIPHRGYGYTTESPAAQRRELKSFWV